MSGTTWHPPTPPTIDENGTERHPAYGSLRVGRITTNPGVTLFDSDLQHTQLVRITLSGSTRSRDLHRDWLNATERLVEIDMSEAQWAALVSSLNTSGVPVTIRGLPGQMNIDGLEYAPRLAASMAETADAADLAFDAIQAAMAAYDALDAKGPAKERREALSKLRSVIANSTANVNFAGEQMRTHVEDVVTRARADIEAMVTAHANNLGLEADQRPNLSLTAD